MQLEITFHGKARNRDSLIRTIQRLAQQRGGQMGAGKSGMRVALCPMGYLDFGWSKEGGLFGPWKITGGSITTPGGPGFHRAVVEFLSELAKKELKELQVEDDTHYWEHRDMERLLQESYYPWLTQELEGALEKLRQSPENVPLFWDEEEVDYRPEDVPNTVYTPTGRFSSQWIQERLEQGDIQTLAQRLFLWPASGYNALYYRNGALKQIWQNCCFAPSDRSYDDERSNAFILKLLEQAAKLDPTVPLPVSTYRELCIMAGQDFVISEDAPEMEEEYVPGYHRGELIYRFEELEIPLPGAYRCDVETSSGVVSRTWQDEESESPVWRASRYQAKGGPGEWNLDLSDFQEMETLDLEGGQARWGWREVPDLQEVEVARFQVLGEVITESAWYEFTIAYMEPEQREDLYARMRRIKRISSPGKD